MTIDEALEYALSQGEIGVQIAAYAGDELIVDACAGAVAYGPDQEPVQRSTVFPIFSVTKAVTATAVHIQAERGLSNTTLRWRPTGRSTGPGARKRSR